MCVCVLRGLFRLLVGGKGVSIGWNGSGEAVSGGGVRGIVARKERILCEVER